MFVEERIARLDRRAEPFVVEQLRKLLFEERTLGQLLEIIIGVGALPRDPIGHLGVVAHIHLEPAIRIGDLFAEECLAHIAPLRFGVVGAGRFIGFHSGGRSLSRHLRRQHRDRGKRYGTEQAGHAFA